MTPDQIVNVDLKSYDPKFEIYPMPQGELDANPASVQKAAWK